MEFTVSFPFMLTSHISKGSPRREYQVPEGCLTTLGTCRHPLALRSLGFPPTVEERPG